MKRLIAVLILLAPALASADDLPTQLFMTQGSAIGQTGGVEFSGGDGTSFTASGFGGTSSETLPGGSAGTPTEVLFGGGGLDMFVSGTFLPSGPTFSSIDQFGDQNGLVRFEGFVTVTHAGRYTAPFFASMDFNCGECGGIPMHIEGTGLFTSTWTYDPSDNTVQMTGQAHYIFGAPEPATASLLLLGFAGLTLLARRRRSEHTLGME